MKLHSKLLLLLILSAGSSAEPHRTSPLSPGVSTLVDRRGKGGDHPSLNKRERHNETSNFIYSIYTNPQQIRHKIALYTEYYLQYITDLIGVVCLL